MDTIPLPFTPVEMIPSSFDHVMVYNFGALLALWCTFALIDVVRRRMA